MAEHLPIHPGEILVSKFLIPLGISQTRLAARLGVPLAQVDEICRGERAITVDTALQLANIFGRCATYWMTRHRAPELRPA